MSKILLNLTIIICELFYHLDDSLSCFNGFIDDLKLKAVTQWLTDSLTESLTHSLTYSLNNSPTHWHTGSLTDSLTFIYSLSLFIDLFTKIEMEFVKYCGIWA